MSEIAPEADISRHDKIDANDPDRTFAWPTLAAPPLCAGWYVSTNNSRSVRITMRCPDGQAP